LSGRFDEVRRESEPAMGSPFVAIGQIERWIDWCRNVIARRPADHVHAQALLAIALKMAGADDEAAATAEGLLSVADATDNPNFSAWALFAYGTAHRELAPDAAYEALRRGLTIAQDSGSRQTESSIASMLSPLAVNHGEPMDALSYAILSLRYYYDSGNVYLVRNPLAILAVVFDRLGRYEPAAVISGFAVDPFTRSALPEIDTAVAHSREVLGDEVFESFSRAGEHMATAEMVAYALGQTDAARAEFEHTD
jgi:tetratricopeptide (TPR) repeat protein